ncbi:TetR/AcrR family transcriptional regulator [Mycolicibacterium palauense]|uniref:TetR/AcrR family transcriptional regulator n=1 Tax=Mycolicibacterium palauense TaxID=2034511 RepID=UPI000BFF0E7D|nr:TetR/AcrR family transcriptional regulator [Mycolicibacterium palauense]
MDSQNSRGPAKAESTPQSALQRARGRPKRSGGDGARRRLLDAGRHAFAVDGFSGASVQTILERANVSAPGLYHHFGSKTGLFVAVSEEVYARFLEQLRSATEDIERFDEALAAAITAAVSIHRNDPTLAPMAIAVQMDVRRDAELRRELSAMVGEFRSFAESLARREDACAGDATKLRAMTLGVIALLNGLSTLAVTVQDPDDFAAAANALTALVTQLDHGEGRRQARRRQARQH